MKRQQFLHRPAMVRDSSRHGRRGLLAGVETLVRRTKVRDRAHQEHPLVQCQGLACQCTAPTRQRREAFPERRVQWLNVRRIMDTDIAHASLASGRPGPIGAEYRRGIQDMLLLAVRGSVPRGVCQDPHCRYKCASPRLSAELPIERSQGKIQDLMFVSGTVL